MIQTLQLTYLPCKLNRVRKVKQKLVEMLIEASSSSSSIETLHRALKNWLSKAFSNANSLSRGIPQRKPNKIKRHLWRIQRRRQPKYQTYANSQAQSMSSGFWVRSKEPSSWGLMIQRKASSKLVCWLKKSHRRRAYLIKHSSRLVQFLSQSRRRIRIGSKKSTRYWR